MKRDNVLGWLAAAVITAALILDFAGEHHLAHLAIAIFAFLQTMRLALLHRWWAAQIADLRLKMGMSA